MDVNRRHPRYPVSLWAIERAPGISYYHHVSNLSASGLFLEKPVPLPVGEHFPLELPLPGGPTVNAHGIVVHAIDGGGNGVVLLGLGDEDRDALEGYLANLSKTDT